MFKRLNWVSATLRLPTRDRMGSLCFFLLENVHLDQGLTTYRSSLPSYWIQSTMLKATCILGVNFFTLNCLYLPEAECENQELDYITFEVPPTL